MKHDIVTKAAAIQTYLNKGSLVNVAAQYNIHPVTLCRWLNSWKGDKKEIYKRHWARPIASIEKMVMRLKEKNPALTIKRAGQILAEQGIAVTGKVIYNVWKRYNYVNRSHDDLYTPFGSLTPEAKCKIEYVKFLLKNDNRMFALENKKALVHAARILNDLPSIPAQYKEILTRIPEYLLSLRRRMERLYSQWAEIPAPKYLNKIRRIKIALEKRGYFYSSMIAGVMELVVLHRMRNPEQELRLNALLRRRKGNMRDAGLNYTLVFLAGTAHAEKMNIKKALDCAKRCKKILGSLPYPVYIESYGDFMTILTDFNKALYFYKKSMGKASDREMVKRLYLKISSACVLAGRYHEALRYLGAIKLDHDEDHYESYCLCRALANLGTGNFKEALSITRKALEKMELKQFRNAIYAASFCLAAINQVLGNTGRGREILKRYLPLLRKYQMTREVIVLRYLLDEVQPDKRLTYLPSFRLLYLLKQAQKGLKLNDYKVVLSYARKKGLLGFLHRVLIFKSDLAVKFLNAGLDIKVPKSILTLPVFNKEMSVYHIKFLGNLIIMKNQEYCRVRLLPQEKAFLIHFARRAGEPGKFLTAHEVYQNFWRRSAQPASQLSHLLVRLKKELMMPRYLIGVLWGGEKRMFNHGVCFGNDYQDFEITITQAKALERAGEWAFAKKEYHRAFRLFRGIPFNKMYDQWSEDMRHSILMQLEAETLHFASACLAHNDRKGAQRILAKVAKIIPHSKKISSLLHG